MDRVLRRAGIEQVGRNWCWFLRLGIASIVLGTIALGYSILVTLASVVFLGVLLLMSAVAEAVATFQARAWSGFFLHLLGAVLDAVVGFLFVTRPIEGAMDLTLVLAVLFMVGGVFRIVAAISLQFPNWGWTVVGGVISVGLGIALRASWPISGLQFVGICVALDLIFRGWGIVMLAIALKSVRSALNTNPT